MGKTAKYEIIERTVVFHPGDESSIIESTRVQYFIAKYEYA